MEFNCKSLLVIPTLIIIAYWIVQILPPELREQLPSILRKDPNEILPPAVTAHLLSLLSRNHIEPLTKTNVNEGSNIDKETSVSSEPDEEKGLPLPEVDPSRKFRISHPLKMFKTKAKKITNSDNQNSPAKTGFPVPNTAETQQAAKSSPAVATSPSQISSKKSKQSRKGGMYILSSQPTKVAPPEPPPPPLPPLPPPSEQSIGKPEGPQLTTPSRSGELQEPSKQPVQTEPPAPPPPPLPAQRVIKPQTPMSTTPTTSNPQPPVVGGRPGPQPPSVRPEPTPPDPVVLPIPAKTAVVTPSADTKRASRRGDKFVPQSEPQPHSAPSLTSENSNAAPPEPAPASVLRTELPGVSTTEADAESDSSSVDGGDGNGQPQEEPTAPRRKSLISRVRAHVPSMPGLRKKKKKEKKTADGTTEPERENPGKPQPGQAVGGKLDAEISLAIPPRQGEQQGNSKAVPPEPASSSVLRTASGTEIPGTYTTEVDNGSDGSNDDGGEGNVQPQAQPSQPEKPSSRSRFKVQVPGFMRRKKKKTADETTQPEGESTANSQPVAGKLDTKISSRSQLRQADQQGYTMDVGVGATTGGVEIGLEGPPSPPSSQPQPLRDSGTSMDVAFDDDTGGGGTIIGLEGPESSQSSQTTAPGDAGSNMEVGSSSGPGESMIDLEHTSTVSPSLQITSSGIGINTAPEKSEAKPSFSTEIQSSQPTKASVRKEQPAVQAPLTREGLSTGPGASRNTDRPAQATLVAPSKPPPFTTGANRFGLPIGRDASGGQGDSIMRSSSGTEHSSSMIVGTNPVSRITPAPEKSNPPASKPPRHRSLARIFGGGKKSPDSKSVSNQGSPPVAAAKPPRRASVFQSRNTETEKQKDDTPKKDFSGRFMFGKRTKGSTT